MLFSKNKYKAVLCSVFLAMGVLVAVFFIRAPIVIVSNSMLTELYGQERVHYTRIRVALGSFRPVHIIDLAPDASPDFAVQAAMMHSDTPFLVVYPAWLGSAAFQYAQNRPSVSVMLIGKNDLDGESSENIAIFTPDLEHDLKRASQAASYLAETLKKVPYIQFGAYDIGATVVPELIKQWKELDSASLDGLLDDDTLILFSWMDVESCPEQTVLVFDDSLYGLLPEAIKSFRKGNKQDIIASRIFFPDSSLLEGRQREIFKRMVKKS